MSQQVTLEDGSIHMFPDDATPEEMSAVLPAPSQSPSGLSQVSDAVMGLGQGSKEGLAGLIAAPADMMALAMKPASDVLQYGLAKAAQATGQMTPEQAQEAFDTRKDDLATMPSAQVAGIINAASGGAYEPTTDTGQALRTLGQFANAGALADGVGGFVKNALVPAIADEAAGRATRSVAPEMEPAVRTLTAMASPAAEQMAGAAAKPIVNAATSPETQALNKIAQNMIRSGVTTDDAEKNLTALGPNGVLADVGGDNTLGFVRGAAAVPGDARTTVNQFVQDRQAGQQQRILDQTGQSDYHGAIQNLQQQQQTLGQPAYEKAFAVGPVVNDRIQQFLQNPDVKAGLPLGIRIIQNEALAQGQPANLSDLGVTGFNEAGDPIISGTPNMRLLNAAKKGLDAQISNEQKPNGSFTEYGRSLIGLKNSFTNELRTANPAYGEALDAWSGPAQSMQAAEMGRNFMNEDSETTAQQLAKLSPADQQFAKIGMQRAIQDKVLSAPDGSDAAKRIFGNKSNQQKMQALFDNPQDYANFAQQMRNEGTIYKNNSTMSPAKASQTTPMAAEVTDSGIDAGHVMEAMSGHPAGALMRIGSNLASRWNGLSPAATNIAVNRLLSTDPQTQQATLSALARLKPPAPYSVNLPGALAGFNNYPQTTQGGPNK